MRGKVCVERRQCLQGEWSTVEPVRNDVYLDLSHTLAETRAPDAGLGKPLWASRKAAYLHVDSEESREKDDEKQLVAELGACLQVHTPVPAVAE